MFEEEAEKYGEKDLGDKYLSSVVAKDKLHAYKLGQYDGFVAGAEFGYNKANEWHYVKDGKLPKVGQKCYFIYSNYYGKDNKISFSKSDINVLTGVYAFFLDEETGEETTEPCFYDDINDDEISLTEVYAWKEIVLPELPKESE